MPYIALAYEHFLSDRVEKALEVLREGETRFEALSENPRIHALSPAFTHVLKATKARFLVRKGKADHSYKVSIHFLSEKRLKNAPIPVCMTNTLFSTGRVVNPGRRGHG